MKKRYYIIIAIVAYFTLLLAGMPAGTVLWLLPENGPVEISDPSGSLWNGRTAHIVIDNTHRLEDASWSVKPFRLLTGKAAVAVETRYLDKPLSAIVTASLLGTLGIEKLQYRTDASALGNLAALPVGELSGDVDIRIQTASWSHGSVPRATGSIAWQNAAITVAETASLGTVDIQLTEGENAPLTAAITNKGGQIDIDGSARVEAGGEFVLDIRLKPQPGAGGNIGNSIAMFARRMPDGRYSFTQKGSLQQFGLM